MVLEDYTQQLAAAQTASQDVLELSLQEVTTATAPVHLQQTGTDNTIIVYNPLAYDRDEIVAVDLPPPPSTSAPSSHKSSSPSSSSSPPPASDVWPAILDCNSQLIIAQASSPPPTAPFIFARKFLRWDMLCSSSTTRRIQPSFSRSLFLLRPLSQIMFWKLRWMRRATFIPC
jgi:hypothetical protein